MDEKIWVIFGSQTGQAEAISQEVADRLSSHHLLYHILCMDEALHPDGAKGFFADKRLFVFVLSSTGDGDPPDNAAKFIRRLNDRSLDSKTLSHVSYALLGLGDSNYSTFHGCPKKFGARLEELGAREFYTSGWADDAVGLEDVVEPWLDGLATAAAKAHRQPSTAASSQPSQVQAQLTSKDLANDFSKKMSLEEEDGLSPVQVELNFPAEEPCLVRGAEELRKEEGLRVPVASKPYLRAELTGKRMSEDEASSIPWQGGSEFPGSLGGLRQVSLRTMRPLTKTGALVRKWEMEIDLGPAKEPLEAMSIDSYEPGDAFYFLAPNPQSEVDFILRRLELRGEEEVLTTLLDGASKAYPAHIPRRATTRLLFRDCLDIRRTPGRPLLRIMAEAATSEEDRRRLLELCSSQGSEELLSFVRRPGLSLVDVLAAFPSVKPPLSRLLELLPRLQPRPYSVASARVVHGRRVRFAFSEVEIPAGDGRSYAREGLATGFLRRQSPMASLRVIFQEPKFFRLPSQGAAETDLILIGPGTGVTPLLSFLHQLRYFDQQKEKPSNVRRLLFFGARQLELDGLYVEEMIDFERDGTLTGLHLVESRGSHDSSSHPWRHRIQGLYVQDAILKVGDEVGEILSRAGSRVYVCGDGKAMSTEVFKALEAVLSDSQKGQDSRLLPDSISPKDFLMSMKRERRYVEDVWA